MTIFIMYNQRTGDKVAAKIVDKTKLSEEDLDALATEIVVLDSLSHPHIIK